MKNYYYFGYCLPFWFFLKHYIKWSCLWMVSHALSFNILAGVPGVPRDDQWRNQIEFIFLYNQKDRIIFWKCLGDWLTVHHSITLVDIQLDAQNSCLFTYNTFIKILYMFRALPCSSSGGLRHNCIYATSGIVTLCRWLSCAPVKKELFS